MRQLHFNVEIVCFSMVFCQQIKCSFHHSQALERRVISDDNCKLSQGPKVRNINGQLEKTEL